MCEKCNADEYGYKKDTTWVGEDFLDNNELDDLETEDYYDEMTTEFQDRLWEQWDDLILSGIVRTIYNALGKDVLNRFANWEATTTDKKKMKEYISGQASKKISSMLTEDFKKIMETYLLYVANYGWQSVFNQVGIDREFWRTSQTMGKIIEDRVKWLWKGLDQTTTNYLADHIVEGMIIWLTIAELTKELKEVWKDIVVNRAGMIMTTETNTMLQTSRVHVGKELWATLKIWHATEDEKTCSSCMDLDGEVCDVSEAFSGLAINAPLHPSCRCWVEIVFEWPIDDTIEFEGF